MKKKEFKKNTFNVEDYKMIDKLILYIKATNKVILVLGITIILALLSYAIILINQLYNGQNIKVEEYLSNVYTGYKFKVKEVEVTDKGYGLYSAYCIKEPEIKFYIYKDKKTKEIYDDFTQRYRKYYIEKFEDEEIKNQLTIQEKNNQYYEYEFLSDYEFWIDINGYNEIEAVTAKLYKLHQYFYKEAKIPGILLLGGEIREKSTGYISNGAFEYDMSLNQLLEREKENYEKSIDNKRK